MCQELRKSKEEVPALGIDKDHQSQWRILQKTNGESEQDLANWIWETYELAYANHDLETRRQDLLSKFYEALTDHGQRQAVEYTKEPNSIDEAVRHAVLLQKSQKWHRNEYSWAWTAQEEDNVAQISWYYEKPIAQVGRYSRDQLTFLRTERGSPRKESKRM